MQGRSADGPSGAAHTEEGRRMPMRNRSTKIPLSKNVSDKAWWRHGTLPIRPNRHLIDPNRQRNATQRNATHASKQAAARQDASARAASTVGAAPVPLGDNHDISQPPLAAISQPNQPVRIPDRTTDTSVGLSDTRTSFLDCSPLSRSLGSLLGTSVSGGP
ncbi:hypothetical protein B0T21DRAFT_349070 [Apiosordaria backusii]|uniref:Uncharacterized protein n=1 Tax=Apiosordaria backusii TaxID=314023 RepID=A0AA40BK49_9PEZI|nr:hypothetical protein B0T21DRAFT_349070 [Apiosordaria backusii]